MRNMRFVNPETKSKLLFVRVMYIGIFLPCTAGVLSSNGILTVKQIYYTLTHWRILVSFSFFLKHFNCSKFGIGKINF